MMRMHLTFYGECFKTMFDVDQRTSNDGSLRIPWI